MIDKVMKGLTECVTAGLEKACSVDCPYFLQCFPDVGPSNPFMPLMQDAFDLLKKQEAVKPIIYKDNDWLDAFCGNCQGHLYHDLPKPDTGEYIDKPDYCSYCGRKVKWDA